MNARLDPQREEAIGKIEAVKARLVAERDALAQKIAGLDEAIAIIRGLRLGDGYDKVPLADVADEPHIEPATTPVPDVTPTRATMRRPAPEFVPRHHGVDPRLNRASARLGAAMRAPTTLKTRVLAYLAEHGEAAPYDIAKALEAHTPSVLTSLSELLRKRQLTKRPSGQGKGVLYALPGTQKPDAAPPVEAPKPAAPPKAADAPPVAQPKPNGAKPIELTGALKLIARDVLKALQLGPLTEMQLFEKTGWPVGSIHTVANALKDAGQITGTAKLSLKGAGE